MGIQTYHSSLKHYTLFGLFFVQNVNLYTEEHSKALFTLLLNLFYSGRNHGVTVNPINIPSGLRNRVTDCPQGSTRLLTNK